MKGVLFYFFDIHGDTARQSNVTVVMWKLLFPEKNDAKAGGIQPYQFLSAAEQATIERQEKCRARVCLAFALIVVTLFYPACLYSCRCYRHGTRTNSTTFGFIKPTYCDE